MDSSSSAAPRGKDELILVVDDDAAIRRLVVRQLTQLGYRTLEAANGAAALGCLEAAPRVDLVLTDVVMAGTVDGFDVAQTVAARWPTTRILLTSGFPDTMIADDSTGGANIRLLSKPYQKDELARIVREILDGGEDVR